MTPPRRSSPLRSSQTAADFIVEELVGRGVRHVFGVGGANIEDLFAAVQRRRPEMQVVLSKHEHAAGTAADAYARLGGGFGVVLTTSGGGAMNLVHALAEARASRVPLLAMVGEPPTDVQGNGAFQDTSGRNGAIDACQVFRAVASFCARVERAGDLPGLLDAAIEATRRPLPGPAVLLLAKDLQRAEMPARRTIVPRGLKRSAAEPTDVMAVYRAAALLAQGAVVVVAGEEVTPAGAGEELHKLVTSLDAGVAVTPDARDAFDNRDARFLGVTGAMGSRAVARALAEARVCVLVGTRLPMLARQGLEAILADKVIVSVGREPPFVSPSGSLHLGGDLRESLRELIARLRRGGLRAASPRQERLPPSLRDSGEIFGSPAVLGAVERALPHGGVVVVDAGNTGAHAVHHLRAPLGGRWLLAMGMAGMGYSFGAAVGATLATGRRCTVLAGDGAFFMHGLDIHTAVEHALPITYVIFNNRAHGMCVVRERLFLGGESGYNTFRPSHIGAGLAAMFPGMPACDCTTLPEVEQALARAASSAGPSVICVELRDVEIPPFVVFNQARGTCAARGGRP